MNDLIDIRKAFEEECKKNLPGSKHCISVNSGTSALIASLLSIDIRNKEVITTPFTFMATINAIIIAGGIPVFVDIKDNCLIDEHKIEKKITNKTKVILPVHLFGRKCNNEFVKHLCDRYNLFMIEDAAQAFLVDGCGTTGDIGCFSFYKTKNLSTFEGGLISINSDKIDIEKTQAICNQGQTERYNHKYIGYNFRLAEPLALIGWERLKLHKNSVIAEIGKYSEKDGHYPKLCYQQESFRDLNIQFDRCEIAEGICKKILST